MLQALSLFIFAPLVIITGLLFIVGVLEWEKPDRICWPDSAKGWEFGDRVEMFNIGSLKVHASPIVDTCTEDWMPADSEILNDIPSHYR